MDSLDSNIVSSVTFGAIVAILYYTYYNYRSTYNFWSSRNVPGPRPLPIFGNSLSYMYHSVPATDDYYKSKYGDVYGIYEGNEPVLHITDPKIIDKILISDHYQFKSRGLSSDQELQNQSLLILPSDDTCKKIRSVITTGLTPSKIKNYYHMMAIDKLMSYLDSKTGSKINLYSTIVIYLLDSVSQIFYGLDLNLFENPNHPIINHSLNIFSDIDSKLMFWMQFKLYNYLFTNKSTIALMYIEQMVRHSISERKDLISKGAKNIPKDYLQSMINSDITEVQKLSNSIMLLGAGFETTSATITFMIYELVKNPSCLKSIQEEIDELFKLKAGEKITYDDLNSLKYLDACFNETLRLHPFDFRIYRAATTDTILPNTKIKIPAGTAIRIPAYTLQRDDKLFDNPNQFIPARWFPENRSKIVSGSFQAFGDGPRKCPGINFANMNAKIAIVHVLSKFSFEIIDSETDITFKNGQLMSQPRFVTVKVIKTDK